MEGILHPPHAGWFCDGMQREQEWHTVWLSLRVSPQESYESDGLSLSMCILLVSSLNQIVSQFPSPFLKEFMEQIRSVFQQVCSLIQLP